MRGLLRDSFPMTVPLRHNDLDATVLGTPRCRVVADDRVAVPVAFGRKVAAHAAHTGQGIGTPSLQLILPRITQQPKAKLIVRASPDWWTRHRALGYFLL